MVAGVALPQNPNSAPFRFSLGYHNITIPGDRSHHDSRPETRHHRPGQGRQRILHPPVRQRTVLPFDAPHPGILTENGFPDRRFRVHAPNTKNSPFPKKPMKQKKKFILITLSVITILLLLGFVTTRCYLSSKYKK